MKQNNKHQEFFYTNLKVLLNRSPDESHSNQADRHWFGFAHAYTLLFLKS